MTAPRRFVVKDDSYLDERCRHLPDDDCACVRCDACDQPFALGDEVYQQTVLLFPWLPSHHDDQQMASPAWHVRCDQRNKPEVGSRGAEGRPGMDKGAVVEVSDQRHGWYREWCNVERSFLYRSELWLEVVSIWTPKQTATIRSTRARLVAPPVPPKEVRGDA